MEYGPPPKMRIEATGRLAALLAEEARRQSVECFSAAHYIDGTTILDDDGLHQHAVLIAVSWFPNKASDFHEHRKYEPLSRLVAMMPI